MSFHSIDPQKGDEQSHREESWCGNYVRNKELLECCFGEPFTCCNVEAIAYDFD
jgi:hypothetical protein